MILLTDFSGRRFVELDASNDSHLLIDIDKIEYITSRKYGTASIGTSIMMIDGSMIHSTERYEDVRYGLFSPSEAAKFNEVYRTETSESVNGADTKIIASDLPIHLRRILYRRLQKVKKDPTIRDIASMTRKECVKLPNVGLKGSEKIETKLAEYGLKFKDEETKED